MIAFIRRWLMRLHGVLRPSAAERGLAREIDAHLALLADDLHRRGMTPADAALEARRRFGSVAHAKELHLEARSFGWFEDLRRDVVFALRMLRRAPAFTSLAVLTLGVGIGVNTVVFSVVNAALFKGFPLVEGNDRLVYVTSTRGCCVSYPDFEDWRARATSFVGMALTHGVPATVSLGPGRSEIVAATEVTANAFRLVGRQPLLGRDFEPADARPGAPLVVLLRYTAWQRWFAGDPSIIGRGMRVNGQSATVIGVMPHGFSFPQNQDLWLPLVPPAQPASRAERDNWFALGRLAEGVTVAEARAQMAAIGRALGVEHPTTNAGRNLSPWVSTFEDFFIGASAGAVYRAMWGAVAFVLLIACANLANLLLARGIARAREISVRLAIGAGRWRVVRQLLVESLALSTAAAVVGWWIARWGVLAYAAAANGSGVSEETFGVWFADVIDYSMDYRAFAYLIAISLVTCVLFGLIPALRVSRLDVNRGLRPGGRGLTSDPPARRASWLLVAGEMALAIVLLAGAGMLLRSFAAIYTASPGFDATDVVIAQVSLPRAHYAAPERQRQFFDRLSTEVGALAGVDRVAMASALPGWDLARRPFDVGGVAPVPDDRRATTGQLTIGGDYFATLGVSLLSGRTFRQADADGNEPVAIVNRAFAERFIPGEPIGRRVRLVGRDGPGPWLTVVGVAPDIAQSRDLQRRDPVIYVSARQQPAADMWLLARARPGSERLDSLLRTTLTTVDPVVPLAYGPVPLEQRLAHNYQYRAVIAALFSLFAGIAVLLAALGLYGVMAHTVTERAREIGVRTAMGGSPLDVLVLVLSDALRTIVCGVIGGVVASLALGRILQAEFLQVTRPDPLTLVAACLLLVVAALIGCIVPARRALRVDPVVALRAAE